MTDPNGFPQILTAVVNGIDARGVRLAIPDHTTVRAGPACLTFDRVHGDGEFLGQENAAFTGTISTDGTGFDVDRLLPDFSLPARGLAKHWAFISARRRLSQRLATECARRDQHVPDIHLLRPQPDSGTNR